MPKTKTKTKQEQLTEISQELHFNLERAIASNVDQSTSEQIVERFLEQLSKPGFSKSMIRRTVFKIAIRPFHEVSEHFVLDLLRDRMDSFGLLYDKGDDFSKGHFTSEVYSQTEPATEPATEQPAKPKRKTTLASELASTGRESLNATEYLSTIGELLEADTWEQKLIGVLGGAVRRNVEGGSMLDFYHDDDPQAIIISTPAKKRGERDTYYRIPTLVDSSLIYEAIQFIRTHKREADSDILRILSGDKVANKAFNNSERKDLTKIYNERLRDLLPSASSKGKDNLHQLKHIGTSILAQIKVDQLGGVVGVRPEADAWLRQALAHTSESVSTKYIDWIVTDIPEELRAIATKNYGQIDPEELGIDSKSKEDSKMADLYTAMLELADAETLPAIEQIFSSEDGGIKSTEEIASAFHLLLKDTQATKTHQSRVQKNLASGTDESLSTRRLKILVDAILQHNSEAPTNRQVFISDSSLRGFYGVFQKQSSKGFVDEQINLHTVRGFLEDNPEYQSKINDHHLYKQIDAANNLSWRRAKQSIIARLREIVYEIS